MRRVNDAGGGGGANVVGSRVVMPLGRQSPRRPGDVGVTELCHGVTECRASASSHTTSSFASAFRRSTTFGVRAAHHRRIASGGGAAHRGTITTTSAAKKPKMAHDDEQQLRVKKLSDVAVLPVRGSQGAAGYDLARYDTARDDDEARRETTTTRRDDEAR